MHSEDRMGGEDQQFSGDRDKKKAECVEDLFDKHGVKEMEQPDCTCRFQES